MNTQTRAALKLAVHVASKSYAEAWIAAHGTPDCDHCGEIFAAALPGKRFCSTRCRKAHSDFGSHKYRRGVTA